MAQSDRHDQVGRAERQQEFHDAENANVIEQSGAFLGQSRAPIPSPGERGSGRQAERKTGRDPNAHEITDSYRAEAREMEDRKAGVESDASREQYSGSEGSETDSNLEAGKTRARVEGLVRGNPD